MKKILLSFLIFTLYLSNTYAKNIEKVGVIIFAKPFYASFEGFRDGLEKLGYKENKNIKFIIKNIDTDISKIKNIMDDFKKENVKLILTTTTSIILEVKKYLKKYNMQAIFTEVGAPLKSKVVDSFEKPGNNLTGISYVAFDLIPKKIEILKDAFPHINRVICFYKFNRNYLKNQDSYIKKATKYLGLKNKSYPISDRASLEKYYNNLKLNKDDAILIFPDPIGMTNIDLQIKLSHKFKVPLMVLDNIMLKKGGSIAYSPSFYEIGIQASKIAKMIFNGIMANNIPVQYPEKIELAINLKEINELNLFDKLNKDYLIFAQKVIR